MSLADDYAPYNPERSPDLVEKEHQEQHKVISGLPVIQQMLSWFDAQIEFWDSPRSWPIDENTPAEQAKEIALTCKHFSAVYTDEKQKFMVEFSKYLEEADA